MARDRAGVVVTRGEAMLMTLSKERRWREAAGTTLVPVRWLGGKLDPGESFAACAVREAEEESGLSVRLHHAPVTYVQIRGREGRTLELDPEARRRPAPVLVSVRPDRGRSVSYLASADGAPRVGDVPGVLWVPFAVLPALVRGVAFADLAARGVELLGGEGLPDGAVAVLGATGTEKLTAWITQRYGPRVLTAEAFADELAGADGAASGDGSAALRGAATADGDGAAGEGAAVRAAPAISLS